MLICWLHLSSFIWNEQRNQFSKPTSTFKICVLIPLPFTSKVLACSGQRMIRQRVMLGLGDLWEAVGPKSLVPWKRQRARSGRGCQQGGQHGHLLRSSTSSATHLFQSKILAKTLSWQQFLHFGCLTLQQGQAFNLATCSSQTHALRQHICCITKETCVVLTFQAGGLKFSRKPLSSGWF